MTTNLFKVGDRVRLTEEFKRNVPSCAHAQAGSVVMLGGKGWEKMVHVAWDGDAKRIPVNCEYLECEDEQARHGDR